MAPGLAEGLVRAGLIRDWQVLAGPDLAKAVHAKWHRIQAEHPDWPPLDGVRDADWIATGAWLTLHQLLIDHGWSGDPRSFARAWHPLVLQRVARPARWAIRAYGLARALGRVQDSWSQLYPGAPPSVALQGARVTLDFRDNPLIDQPLARLLLACQARLAGELLTGQPQVLQHQLGKGRWLLELSGRNVS